MSPPTPALPGPDLKLTAELEEQIRELLDQLSPPRRQALHAFWFPEESTVDLADVLDYIAQAATVEDLAAIAEAVRHWQGVVGGVPTTSTPSAVTL